MLNIKTTYIIEHKHKRYSLASEIVKKQNTKQSAYSNHDVYTTVFDYACGTEEQSDNKFLYRKFDHEFDLRSISGCHCRSGRSVPYPYSPNKNFNCPMNLKLY